MPNHEIKNYDIKVTTQSEYLPEESVPQESHFVFIYNVKIQNTGQQAARLVSRHWIITDGNNSIEEVKGTGVVGEQPEIAPGEFFEYTSGVPFATPIGHMQGTYQMLSEDGTRFEADIPCFTCKADLLIH